MTVTTSNEQLIEVNYFQDLLKLEPKPIAAFVPTNAKEQKEAFLADQIVNPDHEYGKLTSIDFASKKVQIDEAGASLLADPTINPKFLPVYEEYL